VARGSLVVSSWVVAEAEPNGGRTGGGSHGGIIGRHSGVTMSGKKAGEGMKEDRREGEGNNHKLSC
jgi:hypothetical protein